MKQNVFKKLLCLLLTLIMVLGLAPFAVSAVSVIDLVDISVVEPTVCQNPRYECSIFTTGVVLDLEDDSYGECMQNGVLWFCGNTPMQPTDTYEVGKTYTVRVGVLCDGTGYSFTTNPNAMVKINGKEAQIQYMNSQYISAEYTFPIIEGYTVSFDSNGGDGTMAPISGQAGDYTIPECGFTPPTGKAFKAWKIGNEEWNPGEKYPLTSDITLVAQWRTASVKQQVYNVVATSPDLDSIPVLYGKMLIPQFTVTQGEPAYLLADNANLRWEKKVDGQWVYQSSGRFTPGEWRVNTQLRIDREAGLTHELGDPVTLTVNGKAWSFENGTGRPTVHDTYSMIWFCSPTYVIEDDPNIQPPVQIEKVHISMQGYKIGATQSDVKVSSKENIDVKIAGMGEAIDQDNDGVIDNVTPIVNGKFTSSKVYFIAIEFKAKTGYDISDLTVQNVTIDNQLQMTVSRYSAKNDVYNCLCILKPPIAAGNQLVKEGSYYYYYKDGVKQTSYEGIVKVNSSWFYIKKGKWTKTTGFVKFSGKYFYVQKGKWSSKLTDLKKVNGKWFYIEKGKWANKTNTLLKINGQIFLIKKGKWESITGLVDYKGAMYYVKGGKWSSSVHTLYKSGSKFMAIKSGKWYISKAIITYNGKKFYCNKGYAQLSFSGKVKIGSKSYTVKKGIVK